MLPKCTQPDQSCSFSEGARAASFTPWLPFCTGHHPAHLQCRGYKGIRIRDWALRPRQFQAATNNANQGDPESCWINREGRARRQKKSRTLKEFWSLWARPMGVDFSLVKALAESRGLSCGWRHSPEKVSCTLIGEQNPSLRTFLAKQQSWILYARLSDFSVSSHQI